MIYLRAPVIKTMLCVFLLPGLRENPENRNFPWLEKVNKIELHFFKARKQTTYNTSKKIELSFFKDLITKSKNDSHIVADTSGEILYLIDNRKVLKVYFSTKITGGKLNCISYKSNHQPVVSGLIYNVGMMLDEIYHQLNHSPR